MADACYVAFTVWCVSYFGMAITYYVFGNSTRVGRWLAPRALDCMGWSVIPGLLSGLLALAFLGET